MVRRGLRHIGAGIACALLIGLGEARAGSPEPLLLVPRPRETTRLPGVSRLSASWRIVAADPADSGAAALLADEARACFGWRWPLVGGDPAGEVVELRSIDRDPGAPRLFNEQGYRLTVSPRRIVIEGASPQGRWHGVQTLRQLMRGARAATLPCVRIVDYPALEWRGVSDDIARGQVSTPADFEATIRQLAYYKVNLYQFYFEGLAVPGRDPNGGRRNGTLTAAEVRAMVEEGRRNHVAVCPIFQTLGHQERLVALAEGMGPGAGRSRPAAGGWDRLAGLARNVLGRLVLASSTETARPTLSPDDPRALPFVAGLVDEIAAVTREPFFNLGGDEWAALSDTASLDAAARGRAVRAYGRFLGELARRLEERHGVRAMMYSDMLLRHPEAARALPRDIVIVDWHYDPVDSFPSLGLLRDQGFRNLMASPGLWTWTTFYPNYARGFRSVAAFTRAGKRAGVLGSVTSSWGDDGAENLRENNWAGYAFGAATAWESVTPALDPFLRSFVATRYGVDSPDLARAERTLGWQEFEGVSWTARLYHRPPLVRRRREPWLLRMRQLRADMLAVQRDLRRARRVARFEADHLDALELCASRYRFIAERELFLDAAARAVSGEAPAGSDAGRTGWQAEGLARLAARSAVLTRQFGRLWLRHNRPEGLEENLARMNRQTIMLERLLRRAQEGRLSADSTYSGMQALDAGS